MSAMQIQNFRLIKQILFQLRAFGLNPYDWRIERTGLGLNSGLKIRHRTDEEFKLVVQWELAKEGKYQLTQLFLASL